MIPYVFLLAVLALTPGVALAEGTVRFDIATELLAETAAGRSARNWRVEVTPAASDTPWGWRFSAFRILPEQGNAPVGTGVLENAEEGGKRFRLHVEGMADTVSGNGLLLTPGLSAPCDVVPMTGLPLTWEDRVVAGGQGFLRKYTVASAPVSLAEAKEKGWLPADADVKEEPIMISVTDALGKPVLSQLWAKGEPWWRYEETPFRRSRRLTVIEPVPPLPAAGQEKKSPL